MADLKEAVPALVGWKVPSDVTVKVWLSASELTANSDAMALDVYSGDAIGGSVIKCVWTNGIDLVCGGETAAKV